MTRRCIGLRGGWARAWAILLGVWGVSCGGGVWAEEVVRYRIDPDRSRIQMSGEVRALGARVPLREQGPGSLAARYTGHIDAVVSGGSIRFPGGSEIRAENTGEWDPDVGGVQGTAPASYGVRATLNIIIFSATARAASRDLVFDTLSGALPMTGEGRFPTDDLFVLFQEGAGSAVDFRITGAVQEEGRVPTEGFLTNRLGSVGRLERVDGVETLTIPVEASYAFVLEADTGPASFELDFDGQLVAVREGVVGPPPPALRFELPGGGGVEPGGVLRLEFDDQRFRLQKALRLEDDAWEDLAEASPVEVPMTGAGAYFRVIEKD